MAHLLMGTKGLTLRLSRLHDPVTSGSTLYLPSGREKVRAGPGQGHGKSQFTPSTLFFVKEEKG